MGVQDVNSVLAANRQTLRKEIIALYELGQTTYNLLKKGTDGVKITKTVEGKDFRIPLEVEPTGNYGGFSLANGALGVGKGFKMEQQYQSYFATRLGIFGQVVHAVSPKVAQIVMNTSFRMFPDSTAAVGQKEGAPAQPTADQIAFTQLMRGIHF